MYRARHLFDICILLVGLFASGCSSSATYIRATVPDHPLDRVAQQSQEQWSVEKVDANTLSMSDGWPAYSFGALGYGASHANLSFDPTTSELDVQYYFKAFPIMTLWIPFSIDAEPGAFGAALKPTMNDQINEIIKWSGGTIISRRAGDRSEPFPPKSKGKVSSLSPATP
ncbi:MAG TPA: hypothetical protein PK224_10045 [Nitrospira sp.]|jgi:hypothetical protein|nr:hypothetical protein [Nitrospira sp.]